MRKALIYLSAFVVSFLVFYSIYYYQNAKWLGSGYVADADSISHTLMRPHPYEPSLEKNLIYDAGIIKAMQDAGIDFSTGAKEKFTGVLNSNISTNYAGIYSLDAVDKLSQDIVTKFPKHPPIQLQKIKEGEKMLFSYVFRNVELPKAFVEYGKGMEFGHKKVRGIRYNSTGDAAGSKFYLSKDRHVYAVKIPINNEEEVWWLHKDSLQSVSEAWLEVIGFCIPANIHPLAAGEETIFPEIDLFLQKTYTPGEMKSFFSPSPNDFKHIESRLKLKLSTLSHTMGSWGKNTNTQYSFGPSSFFCIKRKTASLPYLGVVLHNGEILMPYGSEK